MMIRFLTSNLPMCMGAKRRDCFSVCAVMFSSSWCYHTIQISTKPRIEILPAQWHRIPYRPSSKLIHVNRPIYHLFFWKNIQISGQTSLFFFIMCFQCVKMLSEIENDHGFWYLEKCIAKYGIFGEGMGWVQPDKNTEYYHFIVAKYRKIK